jgi:ATP-dependent Clp protease ATP-binding subunit ClpB
MAESTFRGMHVLQNAGKEASSRRHDAVEPLHILLALLWEWDSPAFAALSELGVLAGKLRNRITQALGDEQVHPMLGVPFSDPAKRVTFAALEEASALKEERLAPEHLLLGLLHVESEASALLHEFGVSYELVI